MFNLEITSLVAKEYRDRRLEETRKNRMLKASRPAMPRLQERFFVHLGDLLISAGLMLRQRYMPVMRSCSEAYQSSC